MVDVGPGEIPYGPRGCPSCHWVASCDLPLADVAAVVGGIEVVPRCVRPQGHGGDCCGASLSAPEDLAMRIHDDAAADASAELRLARAGAVAAAQAAVARILAELRDALGGEAPRLEGLPNLGRGHRPFVGARVRSCDPWRRLPADDRAPPSLCLDREARLVFARLVPGGVEVAPLAEEDIVPEDVDHLCRCARAVLAKHIAAARAATGKLRRGVERADRLRRLLEDAAAWLED